jgi:hypothetical protein
MLLNYCKHIYFTDVFVSIITLKSKDKIFHKNRMKENRMEKTSCIAREKSMAGCARHICAPSLTQHRRQAYASERRPIAWAKAVGMPNR